MKKKLNILLIPESMGSATIEKVIWYYKTQLEKLGHNVDIIRDIKKEYDIIHCNASNQSYDLQDVDDNKYIFSLHGIIGMTFYDEKKSKHYKDNLNTIKKSIISITNDEHLIDHFCDTDKLFYLPHGVVQHDAIETSKKYDWDIIVKRLEQIYYNVIDINENFTNEKMREKIIDIYNNSKINYKTPNEPKTEFGSNFFNGPKINIHSLIDKKYNVSFIDIDKNEIIYNTVLKTGQWAKVNRKWYTNWNIEIKNLENNEIEIIEFDLKNKNVYIELDTNSIEDLLDWLKSVDEFRKKHNCIIYCFLTEQDTTHSNLIKHKYENINFVDNNFDVSEIYVKYNIGYSEELRPNRNTIPQKISSDILGN